MKEIGYSGRNELLFGKPKQHGMFSWGAHLNKTFDKMLNNILHDIDEVNDFNPKIRNKNKNIADKVFVARYGYCIRIRDYDPSQLSIITMKQMHTTYVFLTDKYKDTHPSPNFEPQRGEMIFLEPGVEKWYKIRLTVISNMDPLHIGSCKDYTSEQENYADCVDEILQQVMIPELGCIPPFLSPKNQCNKTFEYTRVQKFFRKIDFWNSYMMKLIDMEEITIQQNCTDPCFVTKSEVQLQNQGPPDHPLETFAKINLKFKNVAEKNFRVIDYEFFDFLIEIGSSLGLWLGLSVFTLTDIALQAASSCGSCKQWSKV